MLFELLPIGRQWGFSSCSSKKYKLRRSFCKRSDQNGASFSEVLWQWGLVRPDLRIRVFFARKAARSRDEQPHAALHFCLGPPPCAPTNGRPGFSFGFLGAGGRLPKARRGRVFIVQYYYYYYYYYYYAALHCSCMSRLKPLAKEVVAHITNLLWR